MKHLLFTAILLSVALAGCADEPARSSITVQFPGIGAANGEVGVMDGDWPSASYYRESGGQHPAFFTAFDQLILFAESRNYALNVTHDPGLGFYLQGINGYNAKFNEATGTGTYWELVVDGNPAMSGMAVTPIYDGTAVLWRQVSF